MSRGIDGRGARSGEEAENNSDGEGDSGAQAAWAP
jgi:hypothetical protein